MSELSLVEQMQMQIQDTTGNDGSDSEGKIIDEL